MTDPRLQRWSEAKAKYERRLAKLEAELGPHESWNPADYARISRQLAIETGLMDATADLVEHPSEQAG